MSSKSVYERNHPLISCSATSSVTSAGLNVPHLRTASATSMESESPTTTNSSLAEAVSERGGDASEGSIELHHPPKVNIAVDLTPRKQFTNIVTKQPVYVRLSSSSLSLHDGGEREVSCEEDWSNQAPVKGDSMSSSPTAGNVLVMRSDHPSNVCHENNRKTFVTTFQKNTIDVKSSSPTASNLGRHHSFNANPRGFLKSARSLSSLHSDGSTELKPRYKSPFANRRSLYASQISIPSCKAANTHLERSSTISSSKDCLYQVHSTPSPSLVGSQVRSYLSYDGTGLDFSLPTLLKSQRFSSQNQNLNVKHYSLDGSHRKLPKIPIQSQSLCFSKSSRHSLDISKSNSFSNNKDTSYVASSPIMGHGIVSSTSSLKEITNKGAPTKLLTQRRFETETSKNEIDDKPGTLRRKKSVTETEESDSTDFPPPAPNLGTHPLVSSTENGISSVLDESSTISHEKEKMAHTVAVGDEEGLNISQEVFRDSEIQKSAEESVVGDVTPSKKETNHFEKQSFFQDLLAQQNNTINKHYSEISQGKLNADDSNLCSMHSLDKQVHIEAIKCTPKDFNDSFNENDHRKKSLEKVITSQVENKGVHSKSMKRESLTLASASLVASVNNSFSSLESLPKDTVCSTDDGNLSFLESVSQHKTNSKDNSSVSSVESATKNTANGNNNLTSATETDDNECQKAIDIQKLISLYDKESKSIQKCSFKRKFKASNSGNDLCSPSVNKFTNKEGTAKLPEKIVGTFLMKGQSNNNNSFARNSKQEVKIPDPAVKKCSVLSSKASQPDYLRSLSADVKLTDVGIVSEGRVHNKIKKSKSHERDFRGEVGISLSSDAILEELKRQKLREKELRHQQKILQKEYQEKQRKTKEINVKTDTAEKITKRQEVEKISQLTQQQTLIKKSEDIADFTKKKTKDPKLLPSFFKPVKHFANQSSYQTFAAISNKEKNQEAHGEPVSISSQDFKQQIEGKNEVSNPVKLTLYENEASSENKIEIGDVSRSNLKIAKEIRLDVADEAESVNEGNSDVANMSDFVNVNEAGVDKKNERTVGATYRTEFVLTLATEKVNQNETEIAIENETQLVVTETELFCPIQAVPNAANETQLVIPNETEVDIDNKTKLVEHEKDLVPSIDERVDFENKREAGDENETMIKVASEITHVLHKKMEDYTTENITLAKETAAVVNETAAAVNETAAVANEAATNVKETTAIVNETEVNNTNDITQKAYAGKAGKLELAIENRTDVAAKETLFSVMDETKSVVTSETKVRFGNETKIVVAEKTGENMSTEVILDENETDLILLNNEAPTVQSKPKLSVLNEVDLFIKIKTGLAATDDTKSDTMNATKLLVTSEMDSVIIDETDYAVKNETEFGVTIENKSPVTSEAKLPVTTAAKLPVNNETESADYEEKSEVTSETILTVTNETKSVVTNKIELPFTIGTNSAITKEPELGVQNEPKVAVANEAELALENETKAIVSNERESLVMNQKKLRILNETEPVDAIESYATNEVEVVDVNETELITNESELDVSNEATSVVKKEREIPDPVDTKLIDTNEADLGADNERYFTNSKNYVEKGTTKIDERELEGEYLPTKSNFIVKQPTSFLEKKQQEFKHEIGLEIIKIFINKREKINGNNVKEQIVSEDKETDNVKQVLEKEICSETQKKEEHSQKLALLDGMTEATIAKSKQYFGENQNILEIKKIPDDQGQEINYLVQPSLFSNLKQENTESAEDTIKFTEENVCSDREGCNEQFEENPTSAGVIEHEITNSLKEQELFMMKTHDTFEKMDSTADELTVDNQDKSQIQCELKINKNEFTNVEISEESSKDSLDSLKFSENETPPVFDYSTHPSFIQESIEQFSQSDSFKAKSPDKVDEIDISKVAEQKLDDINTLESDISHVISSVTQHDVQPVTEHQRSLLLAVENTVIQDKSENIAKVADLGKQELKENFNVTSDSSYYSPMTSNDRLDEECMKIESKIECDSEFENLNALTAAGQLKDTHSFRKIGKESDEESNSVTCSGDRPEGLASLISSGFVSSSDSNLSTNDFSTTRLKKTSSASSEKFSIRKVLSDGELSPQPSLQYRKVINVNGRWVVAATAELTYFRSNSLSSSHQFINQIPEIKLDLCDDSDPVIDPHLYDVSFPIDSTGAVDSSTGKGHESNCSRKSVMEIDQDDEVESDKKDVSVVISKGEKSSSGNELAVIVSDNLINPCDKLESKRLDLAELSDMEVESSPNTSVQRTDSIGGSVTTEGLSFVSPVVEKCDEDDMEVLRISVSSGIICPSSLEREELNSNATTFGGSAPGGVGSSVEIFSTDFSRVSGGESDQLGVVEALKDGGEVAASGLVDSSGFLVAEPPLRPKPSKSPITVEEWVESLPDPSPVEP